MFYWGTHARFTVSVGIDLTLTKTRRTRSADCICMDKRAPLWEIVYYLDTCIVYLAVGETEEYFHACANSGAQAGFFPSPAKNGLGTRLRLHVSVPHLPRSRTRIYLCACSTRIVAQDVVYTWA